MTHTVMAVVLVHLLLQQVDAPLRSLQTLVGAHDAHVVPHEAAQLLPVVGDHHVLIGIHHLALVPVRDAHAFQGLIQHGADLVRAGAGEHQALEQRVAGQTVGAVQAGAAHLADREEPRHVGGAELIHQHAAAGVVRRWHHGDRLAGDVDAEALAAPGNGREVRLDELRRAVRDVQIHAVLTGALHLVVDGAGDDVSGRELAELMEAVHEALAVFQREHTAFAAHRFRDQKRLGVGVEQAGRVELVELHVADAATRPPGHGDAVAGGAVWI